MLRAEQWLVLGVATLGIYAVYRMTRASAANTTSPILSNPDRGTLPTPVVVPMGALPPLPGAITGIPANNTLDVIQGSPQIPMVPASWYQGRIELVSSAGKPSAFFKDGQLLQQLQQMGFGSVQVFSTPIDASHDIFQAWVLDKPGSGTRWFRARWPFADSMGNPMPKSVVRPDGLVLLWRAAPPVGS